MNSFSLLTMISSNTFTFEICFSVAAWHGHRITLSPVHFVSTERSKMTIASTVDENERNGSCACIARRQTRFYDIYVLASRTSRFPRSSRSAFHQGRICRVQHITATTSIFVLIQLNILRVPWVRTFARIDFFSPPSAHKVSSYLSHRRVRAHSLAHTHTHTIERYAFPHKNKNENEIFLTDESTFRWSMTCSMFNVHVHRFLLTGIVWDCDCVECRGASEARGHYELAIHQCDAPISHSMRVHSFCVRYTQRYKIVSWESRTSFNSFFFLPKKHRERERKRKREREGEGERKNNAHVAECQVPPEVPK